MSAENETKVTEKSYISIGLLVLILIGALRVESTASTATNNKEQIAKLEKKVDVLEKINARLARIEGRLMIAPEGEDEK